MLSPFTFVFFWCLCLCCVSVVMVPSPHKCPGVEGKVCNRFLPTKDNDPHRFFTSCRGKTWGLNDHCEECHDWSDKRCLCVSEYMNKMSAQHEKKHERKAKASSSSFLGFSPAMPVPLCQLLSPVGSGVVTTAPSSTVCSVTFSAVVPVISAAPFVPPLEVMPVERNCKRHCVETPEGQAKMLTASEEFWASWKR